VISIQICEHCGAVKDAETPSEIVQTLKKIGWELKRAEGKPRPATANAEPKPAKSATKKNESREESREENGNHAEVEEPVAV